MDFGVLFTLISKIVYKRLRELAPVGAGSVDSRNLSQRNMHSKVPLLSSIHHPGFLLSFRLCFRDVLDAADCDHGDQGDAPLADHGGVLLARRRQVRRHAEGEGTEKGREMHIWAEFTLRAGKNFSSLIHRTQMKEPVCCRPSAS